MRQCTHIRKPSGLTRGLEILSKNAHAETSATMLLLSSHVHHHSKVEMCMPLRKSNIVYAEYKIGICLLRLHIRKMLAPMSKSKCVSPDPSHRNVFGPCPKVELLSHRLGRQNAVTPIRESTCVRPVPGSLHPFFQADPTGRVIRIGRRGTTK